LLHYSLPLVVRRKSGLGFEGFFRVQFLTVGPAAERDKDRPAQWVAIGDFESKGFVSGIFE
jgi:hypothetical protein